MFKSQKHVFWQALLVTMVIFGTGIILGIILENWRTNKIDILSELSQIELLDIKLQNEIYSSEIFNCELAISENINFADKIYQEAKQLDRYEGASRLTDKIKLQHKKYDILRAMLFTNSIQIKEKCDNKYDEVVYFYQYDEPSLNTKAKQSTFSKILLELKEIRGNDILLISMAGDNEISSINLILDKYQISKEELPVILINREFKITEVKTIRDLLKYIDKDEQEDIIIL